MVQHQMTPTEMDYLHRLESSYNYAALGRPETLTPLLPILPEGYNNFLHRSYANPNRIAVTIPPEQGCITYSPMDGAQYGISDYFTGCRMAQFKYNGRIYIAHIYLSETPQYDTRNAWNLFISDCCAYNRSPTGARFSDFVMFKPSEVFSIEYLAQYYGLNGCFCGIIDSSMNCYTAILDKTTKRFTELKTATNSIRIHGLIDSSIANSLKIH